MHILLTDILTCPRCGPEFGLILLADRVEERRVLAGVLGCSNCREKYPIRNGAVDLGGAAEAYAGAAADASPIERLAALLGVAQGPAFVLLAGPAVADAPMLAAMLDEVEVVTLGGAPSADGAAGVNRVLAVGPRLPFASAKIQGVALTGPAADALLEEGARAVSVLGRLVLEPAPADAAERLARLRLRIAAQQDATLVAVRA